MIWALPPSIWETEMATLADEIAEAAGWKLEDGTYLVGSRDNDGYARTEKMLRAEHWGS